MKYRLLIQRKENREGGVACTWGITANTDAGKVLGTGIRAMGILFNEAWFNPIILIKSNQLAENLKV